MAARLSKRALEQRTGDAVGRLYAGLGDLTPKQQCIILDSILQTLANRVNWLADVYKIDKSFHPRSKS